MNVDNLGIELEVIFWLARQHPPGDLKGFFGLPLVARSQISDCRRRRSRPGHYFVDHEKKECDGNQESTDSGVGWGEGL